jgi:predicted permease
MQAILSVTTPFFALVLAGYLAARLRLLPLDAVPGMNAFVLYFSLPAMLFGLGARLPLAQMLDPVVLSIYVTCALTMVAFTIAITLSRRVGIQVAAFRALVASFPNTGFMGVPLLMALIGPVAAGPVITTIVVDLCLTTTLCILLAQAQQYQPPLPFEDSLLERETKPLSPCESPLWRILQAGLMNPLPWAIAAGAGMTAFDLELLPPVHQTMTLLASAASPVALFTLGAMLWRSRVRPVLEPHQPGHTPTGQRAAKTPRPEWALLLQEVPMALIKLLLHPLLILIVGLAIRELGAPLTNIQLVVLVLAAALPSASNVSLLVERYGADAGRVIRIILVSTVLSFVSFPLIAALFGIQPPVHRVQPMAPAGFPNMPVDSADLRTQAANIDIGIWESVAKRLKDSFRDEKPPVAAGRDPQLQVNLPVPPGEAADTSEADDVLPDDGIPNAA